MSDHLFEKISSCEGVRLRSTTVLEQMIKDALENYKTSFIIVDGLDECAPGEAEKTIRWCISLVEETRIGDTNNVLRILFCGQRDGISDRLLANQPSISIETSGHIDDITQYCHDLCEEIGEKFGISDTRQAEIAERVQNGAGVHGTVDYENGRLRVTCKQLCGSLVDILHSGKHESDPEDMVAIVHETAREYLFQSGRLHYFIESCKFASMCFRYLLSQPLNRGISDQDITANAIQGYYGLQDYTVQHWYDHLQECVKQDAAQNSDKQAEVYAEMKELACAVLQSYGLPSKMSNLHSAGSNILQVFAKLPQDGRERSEYFNTELRTISIRQITENIEYSALDLPSQLAMANLYGKDGGFKCPKPWCTYFTAGFANRRDRDSHINSHELPFKCAKAIDQYDVDVVRWSLDSVDNVNQIRRLSGETSLIRAATLGRLEICKLLLEKGVQINTKSLGYTALHKAVLASNGDIVRLLVSHEECDPDPVGLHATSPFCDACAMGHSEIVKLLLETGKVNVNRHPQKHPSYCALISGPTTTPFGYACMGKHVAVVKVLQTGDDAIIEILQAVSPNLPTTQNSMDSHEEDFPVIDNAWSVHFDEYASHDVYIDLFHTIKHDGVVCCVSFSANGSTIATGSDDFAHIFEVFTGIKPYSFRIPNGSHVQHAYFTPDDEYLITASRDRMVIVWDIFNRSIRATFSSHGKEIDTIDVSRERPWIVSGSHDMTVKVWDITTSSEIQSFDGSAPICSVSFSPDAAYVAADCFDGFIRVWDLRTGHLAVELSASHDITDLVSLVRFSPNGHHLLSASLDRRIKVWKWTDGQLLLTRSFEDHQGRSRHVCHNVSRQ
ncbi:Transcriptional repressor rco-1 [Cladobotryum mycophilum]|uniref:Transcriptional repressor rco-1 n=1 Tax=Cladobotryum mycophilum TaxID=491253 RepID=A0ABR0SRX1_9HYPO